jgi:hypothetical protein
MSHVENLLLNRMTRNRRDELMAYFTRNHPSRTWVEELLSRLARNSSIESVLRLIRQEPNQTFRYCSALSIGVYFERLGLHSEFLESGNTPNFDICVGGRLAVEAKLLDDVSNWSLLAARVMEIPSSYLVEVRTNTELSEAQIGVIIQDIQREATSRTEPAFMLETLNADLEFIRVATQRTLPILSSRVFGINLRDLRRLFLSRLADARRQLRDTGLTRVAAIDVQRAEFFDDTPEDIFCGEIGLRLSVPDGRPMGNFRSPDGLLNMPDLWEGLDSLLVFYGYQEGARRIAYYTSPRLTPTSLPTQLGEPDSCEIAQ